MDDLSKAIINTEKKIYESLQEENEVENKFIAWSSQCENLLSKINQNISLNEKISIMYGPLMKLKEGEGMVHQM